MKEIFFEFYDEDFNRRRRQTADAVVTSPRAHSHSGQKLRQLVFQRNPESALKDISEAQQRDQEWRNDYYKDKWRYMARKPYKDCPTRSTSVSAAPKDLQFESHFECGNLRQAFKYKDREYVLLLNSDTGTPDYAHWFYFKVSNSLQGSYRFHIINMVRTEPLVSEGLKPAIKSEVAFRMHKLDWFRGGENVKFSDSSFFREFLDDDHAGYFTLSFTYYFSYSLDNVSFAYSYPYSYSQLENFLQGVSQQYPDIAKVETIATSLAGNPCQSVTITSRSEDTGKKLIFLTGRVHPGETPASFIVQGLIEFLLKPGAEVLRNQFIFCIVPMLNPDGVRHGNFRFSTIGVDLNRRWKSPHKDFHPTIYYTKKLLSKMAETYELAMFCDFHGHSRKKNVFMYGCQKQYKDFKQCSLFPHTMSKSYEHFSLADTHYRIEKAKESTARIAVARELNIHTSYTFESSMFGYKKAHFSIQDFKEIGKVFAKTCICLGEAKLIRSSSETVKPKVRQKSFFDRNKERNINKNQYYSIKNRIKFNTTYVVFDPFKAEDESKDPNSYSIKKNASNKGNNLKSKFFPVKLNIGTIENSLNNAPLLTVGSAQLFNVKTPGNNKRTYKNSFKQP